MKEGWEIAEVGRKAKASESRQKFLLLSKKIRGKKLTKEESDLLSKERVRNKSNNNEESNKNLEKQNSLKFKNNNNNKNQKNNGNTGGKNNDSTKNEENKILPLLDVKKIINSSHFKMSNIINSNKQLKKSNSSFVFNFVQYFNNKRTIKYEGIKESSLLDDTKYQLYNEQINEQFEKSERTVKKDDYFAKSKDCYKNDIDQINFNKFVNKFERTRLKASNSMINLIKKRNILNKNLSERIKFEKRIKDILSGSINLDFEEISSFSKRAKELLPENSKDLDDLDLLIKRKKQEEGEKTINNNNNKKPKKK